jgi:WD40 repeat protein
MAEAVARRVKGIKATLFKELPDLVEGLGRLLEGGVPRNQRHEENSLLAVRNAFAHGGGVIERRAAALLELWQPKLDELVGSAQWLAEVELLVRRADGAVERIAGADCIATPVTPAPADMPPRIGAAAVRRGERLLVLDPLVVFDVPRLQAEGEPPDSDPAVQAYARRGPVRLLYTPFGSEFVMQSLGAEALTEAFEKLFDFDAIRREASRRGWVVHGFEDDIAKESRRMVGRAEESDLLWEMASGTGEGALWIGGAAGIGKSALMARLAHTLVAEAEERERRGDRQKWLVLAYRFRAGDDRCRRDVFLQFLLERLEAWPGLAAETQEAAKERQGLGELRQIGLLLARVSPNRLILLLDGLDEIDRLDPSIAEAVLPPLRGPGALLVCAGRPEPRLLPLRDRLSAIEPWPDGVPKMTASDIRAQLIARIERAANALIRQDREAADGKVINRFVKQVAAKADGLPIYVELVVNDILAQRFRLLDAADARQLPKSLGDYFEALIARHGLDDLTTIRGLVAAALTLAREPLSLETLAALLRRQGFALDPATGAIKVEAALANIGALVLPAETPERTRGYRLYHGSLRQHLEQNPRFRDTLATMLRVLLAGATRPAGDAAAPYLYRNGVNHLLAAGRAEDARALLADFDYLIDRLIELAAADPAPANAITEDWLTVVVAAGRGEGKARRAEAFWRERAHMFRRGNADWPSYKILLQAAVEHGDDSPTSQQADRWLTAGRCTWPWLRRIARPAHAEQSPCLSVLEGHAGWVVGALVMPDGRILSWSYDNTLRLWDAASGAPGPVLAGHTEAVGGALVIPDGHILSWSSDNTLRLWDAASGAPGPVLAGHTKPVWGALAMADGRILSWSKDNTLRLWDGASGAPGPVLAGHTKPVWGALAMADGRILSWSDDNTLRLWGDASGAPGPVLAGHTELVRGALAIADRHILSWSQDNTLRLWDGASGEPGRVLGGHTGWVFGALVMPDRRILSWSDDGTLRLWDGASGVPGPVLAGHTGSVFFGPLVLPDGRILSWSWDGTLRLWDGATGVPGPVLAGHTELVVGARAMADGRILSWSGDNTLRLWDGASGAPGPVLAGHTNEIKGALVMPDGRILSWSTDQTLRLWDGASGASGPVLAGHTRSVEGALVMPDARILSWSRDETLRLWDGASGAPGPVLAGHTRSVEGALVMPDARILSWSWDRTLRLWDGVSGAPSPVLAGHTGPVNGALVMPDGRILSWSRDGTLCLWDGPSGASGPVLVGHTDAVQGALVIADGRILSWSNDKTLRLWDAASGAPGPVLAGHTDWIEGALVMPDGGILSRSDDGTLRLWDGASGVPGPVLGGQIGPVRGALVLPDGGILSWYWEQAPLRLWDGASGMPGPVLAGHTDWIEGALVMPDGGILSWSRDRTLRLWGGASGAPGPVLAGHAGRVEGALVMPDGRILSWSLDRTVRLWCSPDSDRGWLRPDHVIAWHWAVAQHVVHVEDTGRVVIATDDGWVLPTFLHIGAERAAFSDLP